MNLKDYLEMENIKPLQMASELGVSQATIYNWITGKSKPKVDHLQMIEEYTNRKVLPKDFYV
jgi:transcriptional regulator with XRE-family HTH domain